VKIKILVLNLNLNTQAQMYRSSLLFVFQAERTDLDAEDAIDVYMQQKRKALEQIAKDPQLAQLLAARNIDLAKDEMLELSPDQIRALLLEEHDDEAAAGTAGKSLVYEMVEF
jgi:alkanesulfonate monooxygenase SsuD/methylene tetrahydromethanopterin reductase-like flavin-dependent oxidoreductase (luciferase family)